VKNKNGIKNLTTRVPDIITDMCLLCCKRPKMFAMTSVLYNHLREFLKNLSEGIYSNMAMKIMGLIVNSVTWLKPTSVPSGILIH